MIAQAMVSARTELAFADLVTLELIVLMIHAPTTAATTETAFEDIAFVKWDGKDLIATPRHAHAIAQIEDVVLRVFVSVLLVSWEKHAKQRCVQMVARDTEGVMVSLESVNVILVMEVLIALNQLALIVEITESVAMRCLVSAKLDGKELLVKRRLVMASALKMVVNAETESACVLLAALVFNVEFRSLTVSMIVMETEFARNLPKNATALKDTVERIANSPNVQVAAMSLTDVASMDNVTVKNFMLGMTAPCRCAHTIATATVSVTRQQRSANATLVGLVPTVAHKHALER